MHLYVHIPFCHRVCPYCSFYKHTPGETPIGSFIEALGVEAVRRGATLEDAPVTTLYLGGGTPSMLSPTHLIRLFSLLNEAFNLREAVEITMEANPATFGQRTASVFRQLGVDRVSLGAQSFDADLLQTLGRQHQAADIAESMAMLREAGIPKVNIDLMFSIPGQTIPQWSATLDAAVALEPDHISAYNLTYEEDTAFFDRFKKGEFADDNDLNAELFSLARVKLTDLGFRHYETSNYARPDCESAHNKGYWRGHDYLGLGPSAVSTLGGRRWKNIPDTMGYVAMINRVGHAEVESEAIGDEEFRLERIALLLRTDFGVPMQHLASVPIANITRLLDEGLAERNDGNLRLIGEGPLLVDSITEYLVC
ncbi:MAG: radical SAM family heme chaperone HemW [Verrucomicrobia bacterium]|nr:radical SAM family heme chaperone HemW [Verrucomicrobiota bacterium]